VKTRREAQFDAAIGKRTAQRCVPVRHADAMPLLYHHGLTPGSAGGTLNASRYPADGSWGVEQHGLPGFQFDRSFEHGLHRRPRE
jgi:hypothetical protein